MSAGAGGRGLLARRAGLAVATALGVVAAGAAAGLAAERLTVGRALRRQAGEADETLGTLRGESWPVVTDDGVPLHVEVDEPPGHPAGSPDPLTVVLTHGYALNLASWHYQRLALRGRARLVLWDLRGHGRSGMGDPEHATIDQLGRDLATVIAETTPRGPLVLLGHSLGGMTVMALADQQPTLFRDRVVGVGLVSTSPGRMAEVTLGVPTALARALRRAAPRLLGTLNRRAALVEQSRKAASDLEFLLTRRYSFASDVPAQLVEFVSEMITGTPLSTIADLFPAFDSHDKLAALDVLNGIETLVLVGAGDLLTPPKHSQMIVDAVPGAELVTVPDAGHLVLLEHPDVVNIHLLTLLERAERAGREARAS